MHAWPFNVTFSAITIVSSPSSGCLRVHTDELMHAVVAGADAGLCDAAISGQTICLEIMAERKSKLYADICFVIETARRRSMGALEAIRPRRNAPHGFNIAAGT